MEARIDEIGASIYRLSIFVPDVAPPAGFTFNHFLFAGDEPLLFHCGKRKMFPLVSAAVARVMPVERLRWLGFGHFEADECGSMNEWLAAAPAAQLTHGMVGCRVSVSDMADREPRVLSDGSPRATLSNSQLQRRVYPITPVLARPRARRFASWRR